MSSQRFNFNDTVSDAFKFEISGLAYDMRYPTQDEIRPFVKLVTEFEAIKNTDSQEEIEKINTKIEKFIHGLNERLVKELVS